jgi:gluconate 5-dehydrogenase
MCETLAELGANVVVVSRTIDDCERTAAGLSARHQDALAVEADVTVPKSVEQMVDTVLDEYGRIDVLINNAYSGSASSFEEMTVNEWRSALDGALTSTFLCTQAVSEPMKAQGSGSIVNVASIYGVVAPDHSIYGRAGNNNPANYGPAKAGVIQFTRWTATYLAEHGIRANCISPGGFYNHEQAETNEYYETDFVSNYRERTPLGRMGDETDLKGVTALLASDASKWMTGQNIVIDGGWTVW